MKAKPKAAKAAKPEAKTLPILVSAKTGLAGKDEVVMKRVPYRYHTETVGAILEYVTTTGITDEEHPYVESIRKELGMHGSVIMVNGKTARLDDKVDKYIVQKEHKLPNNAVRKYSALEIEVSAVQQGGYGLNTYLI